MRKISLLLVLVMLFAVFASACGPTDTGESSTEPAESDESVETSAESSGGEVEKVAVRENPYETVISTGASYNLSLKPDAEKYPDTYGTELTDGVMIPDETENYTDEALCGFAAGGSEFNIVIDLGEFFDNVYQFKLGYLAYSEYGIGVPSYVRVQYSDDGKKWSRVITMKKSFYVEGTRGEAVYTLDYYVTTRYVRFRLSGSSAWVFLDEAQVIADIEPSAINEDYFRAIGEAYKELGAPSSPDKGDVIDRDNGNPVLVSRNAKYTVKGDTEDTFPNDGKMLTDGNASGIYEGETWVGFSGGQDVVITVDLGDDFDDIATLELMCYTNTYVGTYLPVAVTFTAIDGGGGRTVLGTVYSSKTKLLGSYSFTLPLRSTVKAHKIEFTLHKTDTKIMLVEECAVYAYRDYEDSSLYPDVLLDTTDSGKWSSESKTVENLLLGLYPQISSYSNPGYIGDYYNTPVTSNLLTDGRTSSGPDIHNGLFFKFYGGTGRNVYFDLTHVSSISKFSVAFIKYSDWAIVCPGSVTVCVSVDGKTWYNAGDIELNGNERSVVRKAYDLDKKVLARYVAFSFSVDGWCGCDEFQVFGTKSLSGAVTPAKYGMDEYNIYNGKRMAPSKDVLNGSTDLCLLYNTSKKHYTVDDLLPYVAYVDADGNIIDTMFDSFLFLPGDLPSGNKTYADTTMTDYQWCLDDVLKEGTNMYALEEAAGKVKEALGLSDDFKYKTTLTICYPSWERKSFGDVDGDGVSEDLTVYSNRIKVVKWFIDEAEKRFAECGFKNLEIVGYYWMNEDIFAKDTDCMKLLNDISAYCHKKNRSFFWIPYYTARGYSLWSQYGFDVACMQPNYVFKAITPISNLTGCAKLTALYHMGIEIEICAESLNDEMFFNKYMEYLSYGTKYGYMTDATHMYYQSMYIYRDAANSKGKYGRAVYDATYHFIKQDLKTIPDPVEVPSFEASSGEVFHGTIEFTGKAFRSFDISVAPTSGSVTMNSDGSFDYYPEAGFKGEVKFSFVYCESLDWSAPIEVSVIVN